MVVAPSASGREGIAPAAALPLPPRRPPPAGMGVVYKAFHPGLKRTVALALQHAHEHGILHRDVKPASILPAQPDSPDGAARQTDRPDRRAGARGTGRGAHAGDLGHGEAGARQREDDRIRGRGEASSVPVRSGERARPAPDRIEAHFNRGKLLYGGEALRSAAARADPCPLLRDAAEACGEATPEEEAALARAREKAGKREGGREPK